jgi:hypothetical protein
MMKSGCFLSQLDPGDQMSDQANHYRKLGDKARSDATAASLPNVQQQHLRSAERLDEIISGLESVAGANILNADAIASITA